MSFTIISDRLYHISVQQVTGNQMKISIWMQFAVLWGVTFFQGLAADTPGASGLSTTKSSSTLERYKPPAKPSTKPSTSSKSAPKPVAPVLVPTEATYFHPGILALLNGKWEGSDHLLNISSHIGIGVTILKPEDDRLPLKEEEVRAKIEALFKKSGIDPTTLVESGKAPLPVFQIEILAYPIEKGYVAFCQGRLFESVILQRFQLDPDTTFQAITWEKQTLQVGPSKQTVDQILQSVEEITASFIERYDFFVKKTREVK